MFATALILSLCVIMAAILYIYRNSIVRINAGGRKKINDKKEKSIKDNTICMLCGSILNKCDKMISNEYRGNEKSIVHVFGCPSCYSEKSVKERRCPICKKYIPDKGYLMGKMWTEKGKRRLHIIACTECGRGK